MTRIMHRLVAILTVIGILGVSQVTFGQKKKKSAGAEPKQMEESSAKPVELIKEENEEKNLMGQHYFKKYAMAIKWNDGQMAKDALYDLIIKNPQNDSLLFNLAYYYYESREFASAVLVTRELITGAPKNPGYLELLAASFEALGILDRALQNYETLYLLSNSIPALYKIAFLQYELKRYAESMTNADILLSKSDIETYPVGFNDAQNNPRDYPMKIAIMNLKGLLFESTGDVAMAKKTYNEILELEPEFEPAKANLAKLK